MTTNDPGQDGELKRFQQAFSDENMLQQRLAELFARIPGVTNVAVLQGAQEYGKDIVFYAPIGISPPELFACVVKNTPISGSASSSTGARTVLIQAQQAFDTPYTNALVLPEHVARVYVITPYQCSPEAMNSIQGALQHRAGQTEFLCGRSLLGLFQQYWPAFVELAVGWLSSYLAELENRLEYDSAFANLARRHGLLVHVPGSFRSVYVRPTFFVDLERVDFRMADLLSNDVDILFGPLDYETIVQINSRLRVFSTLLQLSAIWAPEDSRTDAWTEAADELDRLPDTFIRAFKTAHASYERQQSKENSRALSQKEAILTLPISNAEVTRIRGLFKSAHEAASVFACRARPLLGR